MTDTTLTPYQQGKLAAEKRKARVHPFPGCSEEARLNRDEWQRGYSDALYALSVAPEHQLDRDSDVRTVYGESAIVEHEAPRVPDKSPDPPLWAQLVMAFLVGAAFSASVAVFLAARG
jgi:hypothetical protein